MDFTGTWNCALKQQGVFILIPNICVLYKRGDFSYNKRNVFMEMSV